MNDLERRVAAASTAKLTSGDVAELIIEIVAAIARADATAAAERERALDAVAPPDPENARNAMQAAELARDRLTNMLPRLKRRLTKLQAAEDARAWNKNYKRVTAKLTKAARKWTAYPKLVEQLVAILDTAEIDEEVMGVNSSAPSGECRRLRGVELTARGLDAFSTSDPPISKVIKLPDWRNSRQMIWPLPQAPLGVPAAAAVPFLRAGPNWFEGQGSPSRSAACRK